MLFGGTDGMKNEKLLERLFYRCPLSIGVRFRFCQISVDDVSIAQMNCVDVAYLGPILKTNIQADVI